MTKFKYLVVLISLFASYRLSAQTTIEAYRSEVVAYSHELQISDIEIDRSKANMERVKKGYLPTMTLSSERSLALRRKGEGKLVSDYMQLGVSQMIYQGSAAHSAAKQATILHERSMEDEKLAYMEVCYAADAAYWRLSCAEALRAIVGEYVAAIDSLRGVVKRRFDEGYSAKGDLLQVESRMSDAHYRLSQAEQSYVIAIHDYNSLRGAELNADVVLGNTIFEAVPIPKRMDVQTLIQQHPLCRRSSLQSEYARWGITSTRAPYLPAIKLDVYGAVTPRYASPNGEILNGAVVLTISTPIFHFGERHLAVRSAKMVYLEEQLRSDEVVDDIVRDEADAWANLVNSHRRVEAAQSSLDIARENLEMSIFSYSEGMATILDVLQAQISWLQIYENVVAAYYDYAMAIVSYEYVTGRYL